MKKSKNLIMMLIIFILIIASYTTVKANDDNTEGTGNLNDEQNQVLNQTENIINIEYLYNNTQNTVTAKVKSNIGFKNTKPSWTLSSDKKTYTKNFDINQKYTTPFTEIDGKETNFEINITQVKDMELAINYEYDSADNTVTAKVTSNVPMKKNKPTWTLSSDKKTYTKKFDTNQTYSTPFTQSNGKEIKYEINITQVKDMELDINYEYDSADNTVTAKVISNVPMKKTKPTWTLSSDKKTYTKKFDTNQTYSTPFTQSNGKEINYEINITQVKDMELDINYEYDSVVNTVTAKVTSNVPMKKNKPTWTLSSDKKTYTKIFNENINYTTDFTQSNGKVVGFDINITEIQPLELEAKYEYNDASTLVKVTITSNFQMKDTKPTWTLGSDKKTYTKTFGSNMTYYTEFTQISGAVTKFKIDINKIKEFKLTTKYEYISNNRQAKVTVTSNYPMKNIKPTWSLSSDNKTYTKIFEDNIAYTTTFTDEYGREINAVIRVDKIVKYPILLSDVTLRTTSNVNRDTNLRIASNKINGMILNTGDVFTWSQVVGAATSDKGYKEAAIFQGNGVVQGMGGGICQVSSTLYQAVRNIGLEIIERHAHSLPVSYTTLGNDATVYHGSLDFRFRNNKSYPIKIEMSAGAGAVNCKIYQL